MITETKLDESFPIGQFFINGFSNPFLPDRDRNGGVLFCYRKYNRGIFCGNKFT